MKKDVTPLISHKDMTILSTALILALSASSALADAPAPTLAPDAFNTQGSPIAGPPPPPPVPPALLPPGQFEKCYGVAGENQNHCAYAPFDGTSLDGAGQAKACDPAAWRWVPKGWCAMLVVGTNTKGQMLTGSLYPSSQRGFPTQCTHFDPQNLDPNDTGF
ncbi:MAG: DUF2282 domain-containing protein [Alphaproteobacteria bacterium]